MVKIVLDYLDKKLKIIDYYGQCESPNFQHFYLVDMLKKGHFVMPMNFDFIMKRDRLFIST